MTNYMLFPDGKNKALTLSYDDGVQQDIRMIEILDKYGIKCTFNINGYALEDEERSYPEGQIHRRMARREPIWGARPLAGLARAVLHTSSTVAHDKAGAQRLQSTGMPIVGVGHLARASACGHKAQRRRASGHTKALGVVSNCCLFRY
jgi:peptidoglycan/xylan/chitin deacetylase (PgdA/CDA1 family)